MGLTQRPEAEGTKYALTNLAFMTPYQTVALNRVAPCTKHRVLQAHLSQGARCEMGHAKCGDLGYAFVDKDSALSLIP